MLRGSLFLDSLFQLDYANQSVPMCEPLAVIHLDTPLQGHRFLLHTLLQTSVLLLIFSSFDISILRIFLLYVLTVQLHFYDLHFWYQYLHFFVAYFFTYSPSFTIFTFFMIIHTLHLRSLGSCDPLLKLFNTAFRVTSCYSNFKRSHFIISHRCTHLLLFVLAILTCPSYQSLRFEYVAKLRIRFGSLLDWRVLSTLTCTRCSASM